MVSALVKRRREEWQRRERKLVAERNKQERLSRPNMKIVSVVVVDAARKLRFSIEGDKTIDELKAKLRNPRKGFGCPIDEMNLYLGKRNGSWLRSGEPDVAQLARGEPVPASIKALMVESNKLHPQCRVRDFGFPDKGTCYGLNEWFVILDYPEYIKSRYRDEVAMWEREYEYDLEFFCPPGLADPLRCGFEGVLAAWKWCARAVGRAKASAFGRKTL